MRRTVRRGLFGLGYAFALIGVSLTVGGCRPIVGGCTVVPVDNAWNQDVSKLPVDSNSVNYVASIMASGGNGHLHADFGGGGAYGIPYIVVPATQPPVPINFTDYGDESDPGPYPVPLNAPIEGNGAGDAHVIAVQQGSCKLYEMFNAHPTASGWDASSGAVFDLNSNALRPDRWTSADAAGLPILAGLVRYDEVQRGAINHAVRVTVGSVQKAWVHPATHYGTSSDPNTPPYGTRLRLRAELRPLVVPRRGAGDPDGAQEIRDDRRGPGVKLVHHRGLGPALGRRGPEPAEDSTRNGIRGRAAWSDPSVLTCRAAGTMSPETPIRLGTPDVTYPPRNGSERSGRGDLV